MTESNKENPNLSSPPGGQAPLSSTERIKMASINLRGSLVESLNNDITGNLFEDDVALVRFHGMYVQDDRDRRDERAAKKLERLYSFMIRLRLPGGYLSAKNWIDLHNIAGEHSTGVIKITTRQTIQLHGILKYHVKPTLKAFNVAGLTTIATCGDINRNVLCTANPAESPLQQEIYNYAKDISDMLLPKTNAYQEIWLDGEKLEDNTQEEDTLYQNRYMPRKFKIAIAIPPNNDVDVLTNDIGLIAIVEKGKLKGFNIAIGGGMSTTHGNPDHYARLASVIGFTDTKEKTLKAVYEILTIQRDYGDRSDRKKARLKYTVDRLGLEWWKEELARRCGFKLEPSKTFSFNDRVDHYGWAQDVKGLWNYTVFIENGRVLDTPLLPLKAALLEVAQTGKANFRFTCHQNIIITEVAKEDKKLVGEILERYGLIEHSEKVSPIRAHSIACVALNTCPLALAESQRYLPSLISKIEPILKNHGLDKEEIILRMTGCPNGCARPFAAEIGFVGTALGKYNLHLGGDKIGLRLNKIYKHGLTEEEILSELDILFADFKKNKNRGEGFGDFTSRKYVEGGLKATS
ncbi:MAG TPA: NADPH-dependent assimilatory sulfite reductase hemoprotein subunit [Chitinophagaceae bacterium]|nr:NADPH-dependent assimilatory sulfite reductase hemoprotein subunit [Chitinophagaceae bacterium]